MQGMTCDSAMQAEFVVNQERRDVDIRDTIERERITSAAVKQLKADIREESAKHEEEVHARRHAGALVAASGEGCKLVSVCLQLEGRGQT